MDRSHMRLYFDLKDHEYTLPDVHGVEVSDVAEARQVAMSMIRTLRHEDPSHAQDWSGWKISAVDPAGFVVFMLDLDRIA
jgi:hypothetical protein